MLQPILFLAAEDKANLLSSQTSGAEGDYTWTFFFISLGSFQIFFKDLITPAEALISRDVLKTLCIWSAGGQWCLEIKSPHSSSYVSVRRGLVSIPQCLGCFLRSSKGLFFPSRLPDQSGSQARADWSIQAEGERPAPIDRPCIGCDPCQHQIITHSHSPLPQLPCVKVKDKVRNMQLFFFPQPAEGLNHLLISILILQITVIWLARISSRL